MPITDPIMVLTAEHADGSYYLDGEGEIWTVCPNGCGWVYTYRLPFHQGTSHGTPDVEFGPYRKVLDREGNPVP